MCGVAGFFVPGDTRFPEDGLTSAMSDCMAHRGPDDRGTWVDRQAGIGLAHTRLSILDLSDLGHQPMTSASGRLVISYNGEIYNYRELRERLDSLGHSFESDTDTEVLLAAVEAWGLDRALERFVGMFAFGLWDRETQELRLVRDRVGIKPLYYGHVDGTLVFGSELRPLRRFADRDLQVDPGALSLYLRHGYVPSPHCIYRGFRKLQPGRILTARREGGNGIETTLRTYWSLRDVARAGTRNPVTADPERAANELEERLQQAVKARTVADVPLGAFLSGGIDSSMVVSLLQAVSTSPTRTFSIGFHKSAYDEAPHARRVADHLGTDHTELYVMPDEARAVIPRLPEIYDEPFADSSQVPTFLVSRMARQEVTVSLSGDGGDELFGGYNSYLYTRRIWRAAGWAPKDLRRAFGSLLQIVPASVWNIALTPVRPLLPAKQRGSALGGRMHKLGEMLSEEGPVAMYRHFMSHWEHPDEVVLGDGAISSPMVMEATAIDLPSFTELMMYLDTVSYLPDDILTKVDRASMAVSLETRVPILDHRVVEFAWRVPLSMKIRGGVGKHLLRRVLHRYVPQELTERPKMGFGVPIDSWLRGPLRDWADELLAEDRLREEGYFRPEPIRKRWEEHLSGELDRHYQLWDVLMFQAWQDSQ